VTSLLIVVLRPLAMTVGLVDLPDARKSHHGPIPLIGGLAIFASVAVACLLPRITGLSVSVPEVLSFLAAGLLLVGVGVVDDFIELSPAVRFVAQAVAALAMIYGADVVLSDLGGMTPSGTLLQLGVLAVPFTIFTTVGVINALNMCDGMDGLSGTQALISLAGFAIALSLWGDPADLTLLTVLGGGVLGFLLFNMRLPGRSRAAIFLGDAGSMFLGFALTWFAISLSQDPGRVLKPAAALWFIMVPIMDAVAMMLRRIAKGRSPFAPDREHLHHIFLLAGYSVNQTVAVMAAISAVGVAVGLASTWLGLPDLVIAGAFLAAGLLYFWLIMHAWSVMRFLHRSICRRRSQTAERRMAPDRRRPGTGAWQGAERRSGVDRRGGLPRRAEDAARCRPYPATPRSLQAQSGRPLQSQPATSTPPVA
jgi:UDP-GlcNAc:undecaprenyl-phosphate GlcNAc-1-phosphate transferase